MVGSGRSYEFLEDYFLKMTPAKPVLTQDCNDTIINNSPEKDQVEQQTVNVPGKFECDTIQAWYIIMHGVLRADCIIVAPVDTILLTDVNIYHMSTAVHFQKL